MKYYLLLIIFGLFIPRQSSGQWQVADFKSLHAKDVDFPTLDAAYITGEQGLLYKSIDAGQTWMQIHDFGPFSNLANPNFISADTGFVNANGGIYRTFDGGTTWTAVSANWMSSTGLPISSIKIAGRQIFASYASNDTSYILRSDDYGTTMIIVLSHFEKNAKPWRFSFLNSLNGYFINPNALEQVYKTTDGGNTLDTLFITTGPLILQEKFDFVDLQNGYLYGSHASESHPTRTWGTGTFYFPIDLDGFGVLPVLDLDYKTSRLYASSLYGKIYFSENNGQTWIEQATPVNYLIEAIAFADENHGIAVSGNQILYTNNGGVSGILSLDGTSSVGVSPNPALNTFQVNIDQHIQIKKMVLFDLNGQVVRSFNPNMEQHDLTGLPKGMYLLHMVTTHGEINKHIAFI